MKPFSAFYDHLLPELPGCTTAFLDLHLRQVARDFCERTSAWRGDTSPVDPDGAELTYALVLPEDKVDLVRLSKFTVNGVLWWQDRIADPRECAEAARFGPGNPPFTLDADSELYTMRELPDGAMVFTAAMKPSLAATSLPDLLLNQHLESLRAGVFSRLMRMGGKKWSNPPLAVAYESEFTRRMNRAALTAARDNVRGPLRSTLSPL